jgi:GSH-dependent disulfide-bond oxidoreductase
MLKFYFNGAPNPNKVSLLLEELEVPYEPIPVDIRNGEQFDADYVEINPNSKVPAIVDDGHPVFDSNAILLYLAEKHGRFLPADRPGNRGRLLSWLMFIASGVGPYSGQSVHFRTYAPEEIPYARNRYQREAERHYRILDDRLGANRYMLGEEYTIVDMAMWGWARAMNAAMGEEISASMTNVQRLVDEISERPAAVRALALKDRFTFKSELDDAARKFLFPQNYPAGS